MYEPKRELTIIYISHRKQSRMQIVKARLLTNGLVSRRELFICQLKTVFSYSEDLGRKKESNVAEGKQIYLA